MTSRKLGTLLRALEPPDDLDSFCEEILDAERIRSAFVLEELPERRMLREIKSIERGLRKLR